MALEVLGGGSLFLLIRGGRLRRRSIPALERMSRFCFNQEAQLKGITKWLDAQLRYEDIAQRQRRQPAPHVVTAAATAMAVVIFLLTLGQQWG